MQSRASACLLLLICFPVLLNAAASSGNGGTESLILGCGLGAGGGKDSDGRQWSPDEKYLSGGRHSVTFKASFQDPSLLSQVPYMTARVFTSEATYKFPVQGDKRYWLRLHFYPSVYDTFDPVDSYFSVKANNLTLLSNFSASVTCQALSQAYLDREYSLAPLHSDTLSITFTPSDKHKGAFAFVNGIQLIQMPELFDEAPLMGFDHETMDTKSLHFQTMFRLNVGGQYISPNEDSGLTRMWYDDRPYIYGAATGVTNQATKEEKIDYKTLSESVAPLDVYSTSRSMGSDKNINMGYNLTWIFQVDPDSMYLTRLHFCDYHYSRSNQIVFKVYINNHTAETAADVIGWSGGKGVPTYKDYVIYVNDHPGDDQLWLALHPAPESKPEFYDALLNGVEVFKLNDTDLSGPNPQPSEMLVQHEQKEKTFESKHQTSRTFAIGSAAGGAAGFALVAAIVIVIHRHKRNKAPGSHTSSSNWLPLYGNSNTTGTKTSGSGKSVSIAQGLCRYFSLQDMKQATKNFDESNVIGVGGFGKVYKGVIDNGLKVAIKRANPQSEQGVNEFQTEIEMLSKLRHKHLVSLIGFCEEANEMCLVYDYMALGTMREHLYKGNKPLNMLTWKQRLEICIGAARGLHYLHTGAKYTIIHRDVKTTNILLDENWVAKVSDFGLSKTGPNMNQGHVSTVVKGSFGYLDPEYFRRQQLTEKSDVYSFGVVLFEALCARPALNPSLPKEQVSLAEWALYNKRRGTLEDIIDPNIKGKSNPQSLTKFADAAEKCVSDLGLERPSMNDLLWNLEFALNLEVNPNDSTAPHEDEGEFSEISLEDNDNDLAAHYKNLSLGNDHEIKQDSIDDSSAAIFSQIGNPTGR